VKGTSVSNVGNFVLKEMLFKDAVNSKLVCLNMIIDSPVHRSVS
jgi:hypothetical protein